MHVVTDDDRFLFDLQGFLVLRGAIEPELIGALDRAVVENEAIEHDESWAEGLPVVTHGHLTKDRYVDHQVRLNGLPRQSRGAYQGRLRHGRLPQRPPLLDAAVDPAAVHS